MATAKTQALYDVRPGVAMVQKWMAELKNKTGRSLEEWLVSRARVRADQADNQFAR